MTVNEDGSIELESGVNNGTWGKDIFYLTDGPADMTKTMRFFFDRTEEGGVGPPVDLFTTWPEYIDVSQTCYLDLLTEKRKKLLTEDREGKLTTERNQ